MTIETTRLLRQTRGEQLRWGRGPTPISKDSKAYDPDWSRLLTSLPDYSDHPQFSVFDLIGPTALPAAEIEARAAAWQRGERPTP